MLVAALLTTCLPLRPGATPYLPFARVEANAKAWIVEHPDDPAGYELLGRAHAFAFAGSRDYLFAPSWQNELKEGDRLRIGTTSQHQWHRSFPPTWSKASFLWKFYRERDDLKPWNPSPSETLGHVTQAILNLRRAAQLAPDSGRVHLALGFALQTGAHLAPMLDSPTLMDLRRVEPLEWPTWKAWDDALSSATPSYSGALRLEGIDSWCAENWPYVDPLRVDPRPIVQQRAAQLMTESWMSLALVQYREAVRLSKKADMDAQYAPTDLGYFSRSSEVVSFEASLSAQVLLDRFSAADPAVSALRNELHEHELAFRSRATPPINGISPLVISLRGVDPASMLMPSIGACFDLDGDGVDESWEWVRPDTAFVVWDPNRESRIRSGRDLFGQASFGLFPSDGFMALSLLDDDHDGWVSGRELDGVRLWFDRDSDGRSTSSEVADVDTFGITALACGASRTIANGKVIDDGVRLSTGRSLVLFDWYAKSTPVR